MTALRVERTEGRSPVRSRIIGVALIVALCVPLLVVGYWTTPVEGVVRDDLKRTIAWIASHGWDFVTYSLLDFVANVLWFVPFAALAVMALGTRSAPFVLVGCATVSVAIELGQAYLLPARVGTPTDVLANVLGSVAGIALGVLVRTFAERRRRAVIA